MSGEMFENPIDFTNEVELNPDLQVSRSRKSERIAAQREKRKWNSPAEVKKRARREEEQQKKKAAEDKQKKEKRERILQTQKLFAPDQQRIEDQNWRQTVITQLIQNTNIASDTAQLIASYTYSPVQCMECTQEFEFVEKVLVQKIFTMQHGMWLQSSPVVCSQCIGNLFLREQAYATDLSVLLTLVQDSRFKAEDKLLEDIDAALPRAAQCLFNRKIRSYYRDPSTNEEFNLYFWQGLQICWDCVKFAFKPSRSTVVCDACDIYDL